jgi:hypothetical protein
MSARPGHLTASILTTALVLLSGLSSSLAQEQTPPAGEPEEPGQAEGTTLDDKVSAWLEQRLSVRAGAGAFNLAASVKGATDYFEFPPNQPGPQRVEQVNVLDLGRSTGAAYTLDFWLRLGKRWFVTADVTATSSPDEKIVDSRNIGSFGATGDFTMAEFESEGGSDFLEWSIGGAFRAFPLKKTEDPRIWVDVMLQYRKADAEYAFQGGEISANPFDASVFKTPRFDPFGRFPASYDMEFQTLSAGLRLGTKISERFALDLTVLPVWFGRFEGIGDLGDHGLSFAHRGDTVHTSPIFNTPNCDDDDPAQIGTPACTGLVDGDLLNPSLTVEHDSNRGAGLRLDLNIDVRLTKLFGIAFGYHRQDYRSIGGEEKRLFGNEERAQCPDVPVLDEDGNIIFDPITGQPLAIATCPDEIGDLSKAAIVTQSFYVFGRFSWN